MQIKGIKVEWTQTFEHHCTYIAIFDIGNTSWENVATCLHLFGNRDL